MPTPPTGPTQKTEKGTEIPVPKRKEFYGNFDKLVKAPVPAKKRPDDGTRA